MNSKVQRLEVNVTKAIDSLKALGMPAVFGHYDGPEFKVFGHEAMKSALLGCQSSIESSPDFHIPRKRNELPPCQ